MQRGDVLRCVCCSHTGYIGMQTVRANATTYGVSPRNPSDARSVPVCDWPLPRTRAKLPATYCTRRSTGSPPKKLGNWKHASAATLNPTWWYARCIGGV